MIKTEYQFYNTFAPVTHEKGGIRVNIHTIKKKIKKSTNNMNLQGSKLDILLVSMTLAQPRNFKWKYNISGST